MKLDLNVPQIERRLADSFGLVAEFSALARIPTAVTWNRIEGRPRSDDLTRSLRAEVRDPLWMLARQWQFGEYQGEDAGMPVRAKLAADVSALTSIALGDAVPAPYDTTMPLEAVVERRRIEPDFIMGLYIGRRWIAALVQAFGAGAAMIADFRAVYPVAVPPPPLPEARDLGSLQRLTHPRALIAQRAVAGRGLDGARLFADIAGALENATSPTDAFRGRGVAIDEQDRAAIDALASTVTSALGLDVSPIATGQAWVGRRLEHVFTLGAAQVDGSEARLVADQYAGGHLDWYSVDVSSLDAAAGAAPKVERRVASFVPTPIRFAGMPNVRWWEFEDRRVGFGLTTAAKTDLVKLLLAQFALVSSNDWFILPFKTAVGTLVQTTGIVVTDNFGFNTLVEPTAKRGADLHLAGRWGMWTLDRRDVPGEVDTRFLLAPALARSLESKPLEEVVFLRDETANLVWAVEAVIPDPLGGGRDARGAGKLLRDAIATAYPVAPREAGEVPDEALIEYRLMGSVPENWVPLVSVRLEGQDTSTAFLQGAMPRIPPLEPRLNPDGTPVLAHNVILPRGTLLARDPVAEPNIINEEEILRGGAVLRRTIQQARAHDGATVTWSGRQKLNGRGEASSGLGFDQAILRKPD